MPAGWWRPRGSRAPEPRGGDPRPPPVSRASLRPTGQPTSPTAVFEAVGWEVRRCLVALAGRLPPGPPPSELALGGAGTDFAVWAEVVTGVTGLPASRRRSGQAASAGAALLAARGAGLGWDLDVFDPEDARTEPDPDAVIRYADLADRADRLAQALVGLDVPAADVTSVARGSGGTRPRRQPQG